MTRRPGTAKLTLVAAALACTAAVTACGTEEITVPSSQEGMKRGAVLFQERCSGCHTLGAAASNGSAANVAKAQKANGPNFNQRKESYERVIYAIQNGGFSGAVMPQNIVTGEDAELVAKFVAKYSGSQVSTPASPSGGGMGGGMGGGTTKPAPAPKQDLAALGASLFGQQGCGGCHQLDAAGAKGAVGPSLNGVGKDSAAMLKESIANPNKVVEGKYPKNVMPNFGQSLTAEQIDALVAYLQKVAR